MTGDASAPARPEIVCLCGSMRHAGEFAGIAERLALDGVIALAPVVPAGAITDAERRVLGELHLRRVDLADRVLVINPDGYVGESTRREIDYARAAGKPVAFTAPAAAPPEA